ncbi:MAG TPA: SRPBCC family protein [Chitinophagaceae bacterium]|nr:SRPBCC family protein [Chitinophagaceae bacterium]
METAATKQAITIESNVNAPVQKVWDYWTQPEHITRWNTASPDWHSPRAENDVRTGGKFNIRMEAKDGSFGFDFAGVYDEVIPHKLIEYTMGDGRKVTVNFTSNGNETKVVETFEAETMNDIEMQRAGWQSILDNFRKYTETN